MDWKIGEVEITTIVEQELHGLEDLIPQATAENVEGIPWLRPHFVDGGGRLRGLIQAFVVKTTDRTVVVDTCVGDGRKRAIVPEWNDARTGFLDRFRSAGFDPLRVDVVLCTHLHLDHVGWNTFWTGSEWKPTFPNARYLLAEAELAHWKAFGAQPEVATAGSDDPMAARLAAFARDQRETWADSIQPILDAGLVDRVATDHRICDEISLVPTPGHTPGHVSVWIESGGEQAVITGDCMHHPCQIAHPDWVTVVDADTAQGSATRRALLERLARGGGLLLGSHFAEPTAGRVEADAKGFRLRSEPR